MCGICGFANYKNEPLLKAMTARLEHRGPDEDGFFIRDGKIGLGIRRLKIIDLATGSQPISGEDGAVTVVFNGEIYNFRELRAGLEGKGHRFRTGSDTEVLVHLYEEYGEGFPSRLRGMFAFALWDSRKEALLLGRDQFGIKPLFYALSGEKIFFASEIKSILLSSAVGDELDLQALDAYFTRLYIPSPYTVYKRIKKLEPAQTLLFRGGTAQIKTYWRLPERGGPRSGADEREYLEGIDGLLSLSVAEQLVSEVPLGLLLSGGMDSSTALYYMSRVSKEPVKTFTIGYGKKDAGFNETEKARGLAGYFHSEHQETFLEPDVRSIMEKLAEHFDEPFADASAIPTYLVTREARRKVTVALTGIGGDELFGGYPRHLGARLLPAYLGLPGFLRTGLRTGAAFIPESFASRNLPGRLKRFLRAGGTDFRSAYGSWLSYFTPEERSGLYAAGLAPAAGLPAYELPGGPEGPDEIFAYELRNYLSDDLLCLADRASMANSLELRVPFLDIRLVEFMAGAPLSLKTRGFRLKYLLKKVMEGRLPPGITGGAKQGFQVPLARWYTDELKDFAREILSPRALKKSGYLNPSAVTALLAEHESGRRNLSDQLYAVMMFELWLGKRKSAEAAVFSAAPAVVPAPRRVLLVNMAGLGDLVMMTPLLRTLKAAYPSCEITLLTIDRSADLARRLPGIDTVRSAPITYRGFGPGAFWTLFKILLELRKRRFDLMLNLSLVSSTAGELKARLIRSVIGPDFSSGRSLLPSEGLYDFISRENVVERQSEVALTSRLLEPLGLAVGDRTVGFPVGGEDRAFAAGELERLGFKGRKLIGFNPGAFRPSRRWPLENWKELGRLLLEKYPEAAILVNASAQEAAGYEALKISERVAVLDGGYDMGRLAAIFEKLDLFITNDTGPMHLAAAVGTKVAAIFGPGDVYRFAPSVPAKRCRILRKKLPGCGTPCYKFSCPRPECLAAVLPEEVFKKAEELLNE
ncbi:MAG: asparagine synthase (glutamine-hydrolyzing) [Elusimicrobiales bacterium]|jgi:asparagine synthase (glutamine-hydrolysing)